MIIYKVTNLINGKIYIGQTCNTLEYRKSQHERDCKRWNRNIVYFHRAMVKYGFDNFKWEVIDESETQEGIDELERKYIELYDSTNRECGYNIKTGGREGSTYPEEVRRKIGESTKRTWQDPEKAANMRAGLIKGVEKMKEIAKTYWEERVCPCCGKTFKVKPHEKKKYCSDGCVQKMMNVTCQVGLDKANEVNAQRQQELKEHRAELIYEWVRNHKELVLGCPYNRIEGTLHEIFDYVGAKDMRTLALCVGVKYRKDFLKVLKEYAAKIET